MSMSALLDEAVSLKALRPLDKQFAMMVADDTQPAVMLAAALLSFDTAEGHVCLPLTRLSTHSLFMLRHPELADRCLHAAGHPSDWHETLLSSRAVSANDEPTPLKLMDRRLYFNRMWRNEQRVAAFFGTQNAAINVDEAQLRQILDKLFGNDEAINWQKVAAAVALTRRISVISGGPGTGKTTTVAKLLAALVQLAGEKIPRIKLAAPTGKAAMRLTESLGNAIRKLTFTHEQKSALPDDASTLHRLLGIQPNSQRLRYHAENPLHLDVLVVDEASMVDLPMMAKLIEALPPHARVIFLGDRDQLASVEAGAVLGDICCYVNDGYSVNRAEELSRITGCDIPCGKGQSTHGLRDCLCLLRKSYRFDDSAGIGQLAFAVNAGESERANALFNQGFKDIKQRLLTGNDDYAVMIADAVEGYRHYLTLMKEGAAPVDVITAFNRYRLLCALREGPFGVSGLNERVEQALVRNRLITRSDVRFSRWYAGRPVMISRNDSASGLFNGDTGIALTEGDGLRVFFLQPDGSVKSVQPSRLPAHDTAYAMTVHKSQGSEFDHAALVLPNRYAAVVSRELVYTAITRARKLLSLYADPRILEKAINMRTERRSGLVAHFS